MIWNTQCTKIIMMLNCYFHTEILSLFRILSIPNLIICAHPEFAFAQTNDFFLLDGFNPGQMFSKNKLFGSEISEKKSKASQGIRYFNTDLKNFQKLRNKFHPMISSKIPIIND